MYEIEDLKRLIDDKEQIIIYLTNEVIISKYI